MSSMHNAAPRFTFHDVNTHTINVSHDYTYIMRERVARNHMYNVFGNDHIYSGAPTYTSDVGQYLWMLGESCRAHDQKNALPDV